jgi:hypothetical protein
LSEIVVLLHEHNRHRFLVCKQAKHATNVLDHAGLNPFGRLIENQQLRIGGECARDRELLLLPA